MGHSAAFMMSANFIFSIGMEGTSDDSGDEDQGNSALICKNVHDLVSIELNSMTNENTLKYNMCTGYSERKRLVTMSWNVKDTMYHTIVTNINMKNSVHD